MVEIDLVTVIIPALTGIVVPFTLVFLSKFGKTHETALAGKIRLNGLTTHVDSIKRETTIEIEKLRHDLHEISEKVILHDYRLNRIENIEDPDNE